MDHLKDKVVVITGASRGIGAAAARYVAEYGSKVALAARSTADITRIADEIGQAAIAVQCDVASAADVANLVEVAKTKFGRVDVMVNNAGMIDPIARIDDNTPEDWGRVIDVNLKGVFHGIHAVLPVMQAQGTGGTIINISSGAASNPLEGWSHYCASKAGVLALTQCVNKEYGHLGVRSVGLSPGTVATEMQHQIKAAGYTNVAKMDFSDHIPPEWVAKAIGYLCGPGADDFLGNDFTMKTDAGRALLGLPVVG
ncbi:MAG: SDR family oxidoreductase [Litoreibacter sp.]